MKKISYLLVLAGMFILLTGCDKDDDGDDMTPKQPETASNIVEIAQASGFNLLADALTKADLIDALQGSGPFTVFAPTDAAFEALLETIGQESLDDVPTDVLKQILLYHVIPAAVKSSDVSDGEVATLEGGNVEFVVMDNIMVNGAVVISPYDVLASNGVIHTVDAVLVPEQILQFVNTILEPAFFNKSFSSLVGAAVKADLVETILSTPNLTIFAPNDAAFSSAGIDVAATDATTLASVLTYHVIGAKVMSDGIPREAATLNGAKMYFSLTDGGNFINGNTQITGVDIEAGSGVIHLIDNVLMPPSGNIVEVAVGLTESGEFTSLVAALQRTADEGTPEQNLLTVLSGEGPFTVFAPTNAAFEALLASNESWSALGDIPLSILIEVLTYHVVPARAYDKDLAGAVDMNSEIGTANGQNLSFDLQNLTINTETKIAGVNTNATNGVIHVIDKVLVPAL